MSRSFFGVRESSQLSTRHGRSHHPCVIVLFRRFAPTRTSDPKTSISRSAPLSISLCLSSISRAGRMSCNAPSFVDAPAVGRCATGLSVPGSSAAFGVLHFCTNALYCLLSSAIRSCASVSRHVSGCHFIARALYRRLAPASVFTPLKMSSTAVSLGCAVVTSRTHTSRLTCRLLAIRPPPSGSKGRALT